MAVIVPAGLTVSKKHKDMWKHVFDNSQVRFFASLPADTFAPYTNAATRIILLDSKEEGKTERFLNVFLGEDPGCISMDEFGYFLGGNPGNATLPEGVDEVIVQDLLSQEHFQLSKPWQVSGNVEVLPLSEVANISNGQILKNRTEGEVPVIAGGKSSPYNHNMHNQEAGFFTISKSGSAGYIWWHDCRVWVSDSMAVRSKDEKKYLSFYLYLCMKTKQEEIYARKQGTCQPHLYAYHINDFPIPALPLSEQRRFVAKARGLMLRSEKAQRQAQQAEEQIPMLLAKTFHP